jgi:RNA polymerase sigma factor FliA
MGIAQGELQHAWHSYKQSKSVESRNALIESYLPLVKSIAERLHSKLPKEVDLDDLASEGVFGLVEAIDSFDLSRGVSFEMFSSQRIRGAMLDKLRRLDWVPRLVRARHNRIEKACRAFETRTGCAPSAADLAGQMEMPLGKLMELIRSAEATGVMSLHRKYYETESARTVSQIDLLEDVRARDPSERAQKEDIRDLVTRGMNRKERLITVLYYYEGLTMKEVGAALGLSESRVSQMHTSILLRVRKLLRHRRREFVV